MNFDDTPQEAAFRAEARNWIAANAPKELEAELSKSSIGRIKLQKHVIVEVAGRRIATTLPAYVPDDEWRAYHSKGRITVKREGEIRRFRAERERQIAEAVRATYLNQLKSDDNFRNSIELELRALGTRIGAMIA